MKSDENPVTTQIRPAPYETRNCKGVISTSQNGKVRKGKGVHSVIRRHDTVLERTLVPRTDALHFVIRAEHQSTLLFIIIVIINFVFGVVKVRVDRVFIVPILLTDAILARSIIRSDIWCGIWRTWWH